MAGPGARRPAGPRGPGGREIRHGAARGGPAAAEAQPDPLLIGCPATATAAERIRAILARNGGGVLRRLGRAEAAPGRRRAAPRESLLYRGRRHPIVVTGGPPSFELRGGRFLVSTTVDGRVHERIDAAHRAWLLGRATSYLPRRAVDLGDRHGIWPSRITVRQQSTRWGSATSRGSLSLNAMLMILPPRLCDYAILHELCHIVYPNHSGEFWALLEDVYPDVEWAKRELRKYADEV